MADDARGRTETVGDIGEAKDGHVPDRKSVV